MNTAAPRWPLRYLPLILTVALVGLLALIYLLVSGVRNEVNQVFSMMTSGNIDGIRDYIVAYGVWAPVVSVSLMILQSIIAPLPASFLLFANGLAFGTVNGIAISLLGQVLASLACFAIAHAVGRTVVEHLVTKKALDVADGWFERWGMVGIILARLIPGPGFDAISYAAGLTRMQVVPFTIATLIGCTPQVVLYAYLGDKAPEYLVTMIIASGVILAVLGGVLLIRARRRSAAASTAKEAKPARHPAEAC